jgi:hypothetical protein
MKPLLLSETSDNYDTRESARNHLHRVSNFPKSRLSASSVQVAEGFAGTSQLLATIVVEGEWNP